jgi:hypothetical protein
MAVFIFRLYISYISVLLFLTAWQAGWSVTLFMKYFPIFHPLGVRLRTILRIFKFVPVEFVPAFAVVGKKRSEPRVGV